MSNVHIPTELIGHYEDWIDGSLVEVEAVLVADVPKVVAAELAELASVREGLYREIDRLRDKLDEERQANSREVERLRAEIERLSRPSVSPQTLARPKGAVRGSGNDPVTVTNDQLVNWAARIARLAWSAEDDTAHGKAIALAMEMKALTDAAPSSQQTLASDSEGVTP